MRAEVRKEGLVRYLVDQDFRPCLPQPLLPLLLWPIDLSTKFEK